MSTATATASIAASSDLPPHDRLYGRLSRLAASAILPWMLISFVLIMAFGTPNAIVTPLIWAILVSIWSYPAIWLLSRLLAWVLRIYGHYDRANTLMSVPAHLGAFLFAMLIVPVLFAPIFSDGYFVLMASCLTSALISSWTVARLRR